MHCSLEINLDYEVFYCIPTNRLGDKLVRITIVMYAFTVQFYLIILVNSVAEQTIKYRYAEFCTNSTQ